MLTRRRLFKHAAAIGSGGMAILPIPAKAQQAPNSTGTGHARIKAPIGACDCHHHIDDAVRFPPARPGGAIIPNSLCLNQPISGDAVEQVMFGWGRTFSGQRASVRG